MRRLPQPITENRTAPMSGNLELPSILQIEVTSHCNLRCKMCPLTTHGTLSSIVAGHMAEDTWQRTLAAAKIVGKAMVSGYGEPLTNPRYLSHLRDLDAAGIGISMSTNGVALPPASPSN
jgi:MoaA/NifB/PqqE/SkfB family radical SAM enzyme